MQIWIYKCKSWICKSEYIFINPEYVNVDNECVYIFLHIFTLSTHKCGTYFGIQYIRCFRNVSICLNILHEIFKMCVVS